MADFCGTRAREFRVESTGEKLARLGREALDVSPALVHDCPRHGSLAAVDLAHLQLIADEHRPCAAPTAPPTDDELRATFRRARASADLPRDVARFEWLIQALDHGWIIGGYRRVEPIDEWASRLSREAFDTVRSPSREHLPSLRSALARRPARKSRRRS